MFHRKFQCKITSSFTRLLQDLPNRLKNGRRRPGILRPVHERQETARRAVSRKDPSPPRHEGVRAQPLPQPAREAEGGRGRRRAGRAQARRLRPRTHPPWRGVPTEEREQRGEYPGTTFSDVLRSTTFVGLLCSFG